MSFCPSRFQQRIPQNRHRRPPAPARPAAPGEVSRPVEQLRQDFVQLQEHGTRQATLLEDQEQRQEGRAVNGETEETCQF